MGTPKVTHEEIKILLSSSQATISQCDDNTSVSICILHREQWLVYSLDPPECGPTLWVLCLLSSWMKLMGLPSYNWCLTHILSPTLYCGTWSMPTLVLLLNGVSWLNIYKEISLDSTIAIKFTLKYCKHCWNSVFNFCKLHYKKCTWCSSHSLYFL